MSVPADRPAPDRTQILFRESHDDSNPARAGRARDELVRAHLPIAYALAGRFQHRGVAQPDLRQVAALALIKAVDRYDPDRGTSFATFATPTILGELKRYFRDYTWPVHVPRGLQERALDISEARDRLSQQLQRSPTVADLATELGCSDQEIRLTLSCSASYTVSSLEASSGPDGATAMATLGSADSVLESVEDRETLRGLLATLPHQDQELLHLRFVDELPQWRIAERIGVSQMQVSRLLGRCIRRLRRQFALAAG